MKIEDGKIVTMSYTLTGPDGKVIDKSPEDKPLIYLHGSGKIIPGLERALAGLSAGDAKQVTVQPTEGYGSRNESLVQAVPRSQFPPNLQLDVGQRIQTENQRGDVIVATVKEIGNETITVDANPPLAGTVLEFDIVIAEVRDATAEELEKGYAFGPDGRPVVPSRDWPPT